MTSFGSSIVQQMPAHMYMDVHAVTHYYVYKLAVFVVVRFLFFVFVPVVVIVNNVKPITTLNELSAWLTDWHRLVVSLYGKWRETCGWVWHGAKQVLFVSVHVLGKGHYRLYVNILPISRQGSDKKFLMKIWSKLLESNKYFLYCDISLNPENILN